MHQLLVLKPVRLIRRHAQAFAALVVVGLEIPFAPVDVAVPFERQNVRRQAVEEPAVVAHHHGAADEVGHRFFQRAQRVDVQVVRRFVEQQDVRAPAEQFRQVDAVPLAAGEDADLFLLVGLREVEPRDVSAGLRSVVLAHVDVVVPAGDFLVDRLVGVESIARLVDVAELDRLADDQLADCRASSWPISIRSSVVLPAPLGPMMPTMPPGGRLEVDVLEDHPIAVATCRGSRASIDAIAQPLAGRDLDFEFIGLLLILLRRPSSRRR